MAGFTSVRSVVGCVAVSVLMVACYSGVEGSSGVEERRLVNNRIALNTNLLKGTFNNGPGFSTIFNNGVYLSGSKTFNNGSRLDGATLTGLALSDLTLDGSVLEGTVVQDGEVTAVSGTELIGAVFDVFIAADGESVNIELRIDDVYPDPNAWTDDVMAYELVYREKGTDGEWVSPCIGDGGDALPVLIVQNGWDDVSGDRIDDPDLITFACTNGVIAHCVEWGYVPWAESKECKNFKKGKHCETVSLQDYHQACTRMARADYCGTGEPWTVPGTPLDIWDHLSPQISERQLQWKIEAEWTPDGAYCLSDIRQQGWKEEGLYPKCGKAFDKHNKKIKDCGTLKNHRAMLVSSFDPNAS